MENCIFCKIIAGQIPSNKVYEDQDILAFLDINPITKGHTLVIPKKHHKDIHDFKDEKLSGKLTQVARKVADNLKTELNYKGVMIMELNGEPQEVPHIHFHVFGRDSENQVILQRPTAAISDKENLHSLASKLFIND